LGLTDFQIQDKARVIKYQNYFQELKERKRAIDSMQITKPERDAIIKVYFDDLNYFEQHTKLAGKVSETANKLPLCVEEIRKTFLQFILKPSNTEFQYEIVKDALMLLISKIPFIKGIDEVNFISKTSVMSRKKEHIKSSDMIMLYIENYIDALKRWNIICESYINKMKE
jgi:hypothetical protein